MSHDERDSLLSRTAEMLAGHIDAAFADVDAVRRRVIEIATEASEQRRSLDRTMLAGIRPLLLDLLAHEGTLFESLGVAVSGDCLGDTSRWLEWWRRDGRNKAQFISHALNPDSVGFYDYQSREWFRLPVTTRRPCAVGPYVDAGGIEVCTVTLAIPIDLPSGSISVAGGDLSIAAVEALLLGTLGTRAHKVVLLGANGRVITSNTARHVTGSRLRTGEAQAVPDRIVVIPSADPHRLPWQLLAMPG
ncbi:cache domain-containing protein [Streptomyces coffeae]|uniref:PDC sensor domain-containing protein n=1 Tax=Streptomyces coffeae TaxID=621382 RepID=A0ABS1NP10_9ACTN|nr:cache domain-containing protein [Streptomyces coffeae]MBL1101840.1 PDC sensor domain-containing protein [Streptomyces coffeae]